MARLHVRVCVLEGEPKNGSWHKGKRRGKLKENPSFSSLVPLKTRHSPRHRTFGFPYRNHQLPAPGFQRLLFGDAKGILAACLVAQRLKE